MNTEIVRFGAVGMTALLTHLAMVSLWLVPAGMSPLIANLPAFMVAFAVSYLGHRHLTFRATHVAHQAALPRFLATAGTGFAINEALYYMLMHLTPLDYRAALFIVLVVVAALTFALSKYWAFSATERP